MMLFLDECVGMCIILNLLSVFHIDYIIVLILLYKYLCDLKRAFFNAI